MNFSVKYITAFLIATTCFSCRQTELFEKDTIIPGHKWNSAFYAGGEFEITDTASSYNIYIVLRHTDAYAYNNIWLSVGHRSPGDSMQYDKTNLSLGTDSQGWEGSGMNDIWEVRKLYLSMFRFKNPGAYNFSIAQIMRDNPLENIMSVGLRLEKAP